MHDGFKPPWLGDVTTQFHNQVTVELILYVTKHVTIDVVDSYVLNKQLPAVEYVGQHLAKRNSSEFGYEQECRYTRIRDITQEYTEMSTGMSQDLFSEPCTNIDFKLIREQGYEQVYIGGYFYDYDENGLI